MSMKTQRRWPSSWIALAALAAAGCATRGDLRAAVGALNDQQSRQADESKAEQARQAEELAALRARLDDLKRAVEALPSPSGSADQPTAARAPRPAPAAFQPVPIDDSPAEGPAGAWVTIVEFTDFQCPFCARAQETLRLLREKYGKSVRFVRKHNPLPFHPHARSAALAAECANEQGRFWPYSRILFERQSQLGPEAYAAWAREVPGMDVDRFEACTARSEPSPRIARDQALAAKVGANGTPTFFINGRRLVGAQPLEPFAALVDEELAKAKASGIPAKEYYRRAVEAADGR